MESGASIRPAQEKDAADLAELWIEFGRYYVDRNPRQYQEPKRDGLLEWFRRQLDEAANKDQAWLVAEGSHRLVGSIHGQVWRPSDDAEWQLVREVGEVVLKVNHLIVTESDRRRGIGRALMDTVEAWGVSRGATQAVVISTADSPSSVPFYEDGMGYWRKTIGFWKSLTG
jgi:GNAT superfamily N-acetyltransferase